MRDLTQREQFILGGAVVTAILAFFPWISVSFRGSGMGELFKELGAGGASANGFASADGVIGFLAAVATAGLVLADRAGMLPWPAPRRLLAPLASTGVCALCLLIFFGRAGSGMAEHPAAMGISVGRSIWFYLALLAIGVAAFHAFQRWSEGMKAGPAAPGAPPPPPPGAS